MAWSSPSRDVIGRGRGLSEERVVGRESRMAAGPTRPPRPRKEPQPLVIPRSAAEEQRLKLERLMRNPVRRRLCLCFWWAGLCPPLSEPLGEAAEVGVEGAGKALPSRSLLMPCLPVWEGV